MTVLANGSITDVKVTDFGSVLNLAPTDAGLPRRLAGLHVAEQLDGAALDCRADIYSLGAVLTT